MQLARLLPEVKSPTGLGRRRGERRWSAQTRKVSSTILFQLGGERESLWGLIQ